MNQSTPAAFVTWHGARIALTGAEAEELRYRSRDPSAEQRSAEPIEGGIVSRPEPEAEPAMYLPEGGRGLDEVGAELALLRAGPAGFPVLFETAYVLAVPRGGRTLYLDGEGVFTDEPDAALEFTPEGRRAFEEDGSFGFHEGAEWQERLGDPIAPLPEPADPPPAPPPDPAHPARSRREVEALTRAWREDPCRDLAATPGYEAHHAELAAYQAAAVGREGGGGTQPGAGENR